LTHYDFSPSISYGTDYVMSMSGWRNLPFSIVLKNLLTIGLSFVYHVA